MDRTILVPARPTRTAQVWKNLRGFLYLLGSQGTAAEDYISSLR